MPDDKRLIGQQWELCDQYPPFKISSSELVARQVKRGLFADEETGIECLAAMSVGEYLKTGISAWARIA